MEGPRNWIKHFTQRRNLGIIVSFRRSNIFAKAEIWSKFVQNESVEFKYRRHSNVGCNYQSITTGSPKKFLTDHHF